MRRVPAILLVVLFSFSLIAPALSVDAESNLPACCRRAGKHQCGMVAQDMAEVPSSGAAIGAMHARCPLFPGGGAALPHSLAALLAGSQLAGVSIVIRSAPPAQAETGYRISSNHSNHKRGPPARLS